MFDLPKYSLDIKLLSNLKSATAYIKHDKNYLKVWQAVKM